MKERKEYSLVVFDWDGTLIDSVPNIVTALVKAAKSMALPVLSNETYKSIIGLSLGEAVTKLYPELDDGQVAAYREAYRSFHLELEQKPSRPFPGVTRGLEHLKGTRIKMAVATGKKRAGLERSMTANGYQSYFEASRTADDAHSKPHPMMLEQLLAGFGVTADQALMVGDSGFDMAMAANAGMDSVAVTYGAQDEGKLKEYDPVHTVDSFDELIDWLGRH
ncbi:HAD-IA family hydrolase [Endozoicomonas sp. 8E]|uniref:HAD family hydrolase n=1 Tax=Endozoicomonas sp. 8E TaxID=3035692 RepID=UPI002938FD4D|nr:HAD-IA family hydrolase [Endozoicomonas sp. 8E]WOG25781.1 HAD-IA family hydrolase [Endozoicomonas sp. 8E]